MTIDVKVKMTKNGTIRLNLTMDGEAQDVFSNVPVSVIEPVILKDKNLPTPTWGKTKKLLYEDHECFVKDLEEAVAIKSALFAAAKESVGLHALIQGVSFQITAEG